MNNILSKTFCSAFIILTLSFSSKAITADTTVVLASNTTEASPVALRTITVKAANVEYPASLQNHKDESLDYVQSFLNNKREYLIRTYQKGKKFFPKITAVLKRYNLPQELKVLVALESAFNSNAVSGAGAVGYWQLMDNVAKEYGLQIVEAKDTAAIRLKKKDDRTNFSKSTLVAARYLHDRCKNLNNNLLLMVASYNWGVGNVWNAIRKTGKSNASFWDIKKYLPAETKSYVMNFIALNVAFQNYDKFLKNKLNFGTETIQIPILPENVNKLNTAVTD
jgi:membrane-bound lytic murein transglycosylase MltF